jgi:Tol biopolymer transport system component
LFIVEVESGEVEQISNYGKPFSIIGWSSNNLEIMVYRLNEHNEPLLVMYNLHEKKETVYDILPNCWDFAINTDFSTVAYVPEQDNSGIYERKIGSSSSVAVSDRMFYVPRRLSYAPNNKYISFVTYDNSDESMLFNILDLHTDTVQYYQNVPYDFYASWSPNSLYSAYTGVDNAGLALNMVDVEQQKARVLVSVNTGDESGSVKPCNPVWSVEGKRIAIASFENGSFLLYLVDVESSIIKQIILTDPSFELLYDLNWY